MDMYPSGPSGSYPGGSNMGGWGSPNPGPNSNNHHFAFSDPNQRRWDNYNGSDDSRYECSCKSVNGKVNENVNETKGEEISRKSKERRGLYPNSHRAIKWVLNEDGRVYSSITRNNDRTTLDIGKESRVLLSKYSQKNIDDLLFKNNFQPKVKGECIKLIYPNNNCSVVYHKGDGLHPRTNMKAFTLLNEYVNNFQPEIKTAHIERLGDKNNINLLPKKIDIKDLLNPSYPQIKTTKIDIKDLLNSK